MLNYSITHYQQKVPILIEVSQREHRMLGASSSDFVRRDTPVFQLSKGEK